MPAKMNVAGTFVSRVKVCEVDAGNDVEKSCVLLCGFMPSLSCASGGKVPFGRKFKADAKITVPGVSEEL